MIFLKLRGTSSLSFFFSLFFLGICEKTQPLIIFLFLFLFFFVSEIEDLRAQLESERDIRKMVDTSNTQLNQELAKLKKRFEEATSQRQSLQAEKNELLGTVEPVKQELEKEKKLRLESDVIIAKLETEVGSFFFSELEACMNEFNIIVPVCRLPS